MTKEVDTYIAAAPKGAQPLLRQLRKTIKGAAPQAVETMSYKMPHYNHHGRLVYFAAFKDHVSLFPSGYAEQYKALKKYMTGRGTLSFPLNEPLPVDLIAKFVRRRVKENSAAAAEKGGSKRGASRPSASARSKS